MINFLKKESVSLNNVQHIDDFNIRQAHYHRHTEKNTQCHPLDRDFIYLCMFIQDRIFPIEIIDIKSPQCIMVAYRGCYAMIFPKGFQFYYTWKISLKYIESWCKLMMTICWMTCHPRYTTRMFWEECNIGIVDSSETDINEGPAFFTKHPQRSIREISNE